MSQSVRQAVPGAQGEAPLDLRRLFDEHGAFVQALIARLLGPGGDSDDLTQEVFLLALRKLQPAPGLSPRAWLCQAAVRLACNARRKVWMQRVFGLGQHEMVDRRTPEHLVEAREAIREVYRALDRLPEKKRTVFVLFELHGLSGQQIAEALGCPVETVHTRLFHARRDFVKRIAALRVAQDRRGSGS